MMRNSSEKIKKITAFMLVFCLLLETTTHILIRKSPIRLSQEAYFRSEPVDSIDVLFIGSSSFNRGISPLVLWNKFGITSYVRANGEQSPEGLYYRFLEALNTQSPDVLILDGITLLRHYDYVKYEPHIRDYVDFNPMSIEKIMMIFELSQRGPQYSIPSLVFPIIRYHTRWKEIALIDFLPDQKSLFMNAKGQNPTNVFEPQKFPPNYMHYRDEVLPIDKDASMYYQRILALCNKKSIKVVFLTLPRKAWTISKTNAISEFASSNQVPYLDLSYPEEIENAKLDLDTDFFDNKHLNAKGSEKVSLVVGERLLEFFNLPDHRNDPAYVDWNILYEAYRSEFLNSSSSEENSKIE
jgi:hypothetical protein